MKPKRSIMILIVAMLALTGCGGGGSGNAEPSNEVAPQTGSRDGQVLDTQTRQTAVGDFSESGGAESGVSSVIESENPDATYS